MKNSPEEIQHGNVKRIPKCKFLNFEVWKHAVKFIKAVGIQYGLILPGQAPNFRNFKNLIILPSSLPKRKLFEEYELACKAKNMESIGLASWYKIWNELCSNIVIQKPKSDLCAVCQQSFTTLLQLHNLPVTEKLAAIENSRKHL